MHYYRWPSEPYGRTMRAELIGNFEPCMTEIYLHIYARMADYIRTHLCEAPIRVPATGRVLPPPLSRITGATELARERLLIDSRATWMITQDGRAPAGQSANQASREEDRQVARASKDVATTISQTAADAITLAIHYQVLLCPRHSYS